MCAVQVPDEWGTPRPGQTWRDRKTGRLVFITAVESETEHEWGMVRYNNLTPGDRGTPRFGTWRYMRRSGQQMLHRFLKRCEPLAEAAYAGDK